MSDSFPEKGMTFEQAKSRIKDNDGRSDKNIRNKFLINQVMAHEGIDAAKDLAHKINKDHK